MATPAIYIRFDDAGRSLMFGHHPGTTGARYHLCDLHGRVLRSGGVTGPETAVRLDGIRCGELILMVLDGECAVLRPVTLRKAA